jgi:Cys-tRNA(Pro) deacylase
MGKLQLIQIKKMLNDNNIKYKVQKHKPVSTSAEAAKVRGVELKTGVKALLLQTQEDKYVLGLVAADRRINLKKFAKIVNTKKLRMASPENVLKITGCKVGCVHPFGNLKNILTFLDESILENEEINFSAGLHTVSISMSSKDLVSLINPVINSIS